MFVPMYGPFDMAHVSNVNYSSDRYELITVESQLRLK